MLDTYGRKYVSPLIGGCASGFLKAGFKPNQVTVLALIIGLMPTACLLAGVPGLAVVCLWLSGLLDAVDGAMARHAGLTSSWGAFMDICFDRVVEAGIILALGFQYPEARWGMMILLVSILMSMTVFLTSGALINQKKEKSFYYQAGLAERTEGFIFLTLMMVFQQHLLWIVFIFTGAIAITVFQRVYEAYQLLRQ